MEPLRRMPFEEPDGTLSGRRRVRGNSLKIAIVGANLRAASILRLLNEVQNLEIMAVCDLNPTAPAMRLAEEIGIFATTEVSELSQVSDLSIIIDLTDEGRLRRSLEEQGPGSVEVIGSRGAEMVWDLLIAKKRGEEQEKLFVELQVAYDKIRSHERRLQTSKEALERANEELESRLAEIFFTHEFFKALTSFASIEDVSGLIVDGANGILGAEISAVYLLDEVDWTFLLTAAQGAPEEAFVPVIPVSETVLGKTMESGLLQEHELDPTDPSGAWLVPERQPASQAALPLKTGDAVIGVLVVASSAPRELTPAEMERLQVIGNQSSLALQNALLHEELERLSVTDRLTDLFNHGYFQQALEQECVRAARFGHPVSLIMLDIDDFKDFNDRYGHPRGDNVLTSVSAIIRSVLRDVDVAARYGGEEFVVVLPETDTDGALAVAERIRSQVADHPFSTRQNGASPATKTISIGVATFPYHAGNHSQLVEMADRAMYKAKRRGKNRIVAASEAARAKG